MATVLLVCVALGACARGARPRAAAAAGGASLDPLEPISVGSVLFSAPDTGRRCWYSQDIALLRCRRIMQSILPSRDAIDANEEEDVARLIQYFNRAFDAAVKSAKTETNGDVTLQAMGDAIGGYIKRWALPVARLGFYGGTISFEAANKLSQYYENIKSCLLTDGYYWAPPDEESLKNINLRIIPTTTDRHRNSRACKELVFYEDPPQQFAIPIPHVNWDYRPHMMMVPLKTRSLVALESPSSAYVLYDYHTIAQSCLAQRRSVEQKADFDTRFRRWLMTDVLPHLKDDSLYAAFGSVLRLLNGTDGFAALYGNDVSQNKHYTAPAWKITMQALSQDESSLVKDRIAVLVKDSPIFLAALLILWCGPCFLFCYFRRLKCRMRSYSYHLDEPYRGEDHDETTAILESRCSHRRSHSSNKRAARRTERSYPCEVVYTGKKNESSFADSSKTSSDTKSKITELHLKVSQAINVNSVNFEKEPPSYSRSQTKISTIPKKRSSLNIQKPQNQESHVPQFVIDLEDVKADEFNNIISYFSNANSENILAGNLVETPTSVSTLQLEDVSERPLSITENSSGASISITEFNPPADTYPRNHSYIADMEDARVLQTLNSLHKTAADEVPRSAAREQGWIVPSGGRERLECQSAEPGNLRGCQSSLTDLGSMAAPVAPTPEVASARRDQERPTRIPQKPQSTVRPRSFFKAQEPAL